MANLNQCNFIGRLGQDPERKALTNGDPVCNFSIAVSEKWKDKATGELQEKTTWINVVAFKRLAEIIAQYCSKGSQVFISGKLQTRKWQDQNGQDRYSTEIVCNELQMLDSRESNNGQAGQASNSNGFAQNQPQFGSGNQTTGFASQNQGSNNFGSQKPQNMSNEGVDFSDDVPFYGVET